jgi:hypothetical protein
MIEHQQKREGHHILTKGFEAQSPHILAVRINRFVRENIKPGDFVDIKYSSFLKADNNETSYSAILIFKGTMEEESEEDDH